MGPTPQLTIGQRIQLHRERSGKTRAVLGGLVGRSAQWVKAVEKGRLLTPRLPMLARLADALKVPLADLVGTSDEAQLRALTGPGHEALPAVAAAVNEYVVTPTREEPEPLDGLAARVASAWRARHRSPDHRTVLGRVLPELIRDTRHAIHVHDGADRRRAQAIAADALGLTQMFVAYQTGAGGLLWRVTDRAMVAANESGDLHAIGQAAWFLADPLHEAGDWDTAMRVSLDALRVIEPHLADATGPDLLAMWGSLQAVTALTAARVGEEGKAWHHWDEARRAVRSLPPGYAHPCTWISPAIVGFYGLSVAVELRKGGEAVRQAAHVNPDTIRSRPRRARHLIEVARGHHLQADTDATVATLRAAHDAAPETIRYNTHARQICLSLLEHPTLRHNVRDLAAMIGL